MVDSDLSQTVALIMSDSEKTIRAFRLSHNKDYLVVPHPVRRVVPEPNILLESSIAKGKQMAEDDESPDPDPVSYVIPKPYLCLRLDVPPKDISLGWVFGKDPVRCDILLDEDEHRLLSRVHFRINYNWHDVIPIVYSMSKHGTALETPGDSPIVLGKGGQHILQGDATTSIEVAELSMRAKIPKRNAEEKEAHKCCWQNYRRQAEREPPGLAQLQVESQSQTMTPNVVRGPVTSGNYVLTGVLGSGTFGTVSHATQRTTGLPVALKQFKKKQASNNKGLNKEIELYRELEHVSSLSSPQVSILIWEKDRIVRFLDAFVDPNGDAILVMEVLEMGNLSSQHQKDPITVIENHRLIYQVLEALLYLHYKGIAHRDLKPDNILVKARDPDLHIKVADFGVSTQTGDAYIESICGTPLYCAPEMFTGEYRRAVDIWATGVIGLQFMKGLPNVPRKPNKELDHKEWVSRIRKSVEEDSGEQYREFGTGLKKMLELNPIGRPSAGQCLEYRWFRAGQTEQERLRGPSAVGFLGQQPRSRFETYSRARDVGHSTGSDAAEYDQSASNEEPASKRPKKA